MKPLVTGPTASDPDTAGRPGRAPGGELRALTGLRIVAALWVVAFHFHFTALPGVTDVSAVLGPLVTQGSLGVDLFFVLSGFVIAHTYLDRMGPRLRLRSAGRFVWARAGRMWPAYLLVFHLFGVWLLIRATYGSGGDIAFQAVQPDLSWGQWLRQLLLVQMWDRPFLDGASWVGPTWSISAEWLAYLLFPLTALVFFRLRRLPVVVLGFGALLAMAPMAAAYLVVGSPYYPFSWLVRVLCGFSAGVLTLLAVRRLTGSARARRIAPTTAWVALLGIVGGLLAGDAAGGGLLGLVVVLFPVLVGALALTERGPARWLGSRPMVHGGRISYALYLVHIPMFEMFWLALRNGTGDRFDGLLAPGTLSAHVVALVVLVATVPVAHLLYTFVEQPARGWMRDLPGARRRTPAAVVPGPAVPTDAVVPEGAGPVDTDRARLDPPTLRVARPRPSSPVEETDRVVLPSPLPRQAGPADPVPALVRLHDARDMARAAGHGDDRHGDRLAGNLMAAARLRSWAPAPEEYASDRSEQIRDAARTSAPAGPSRQGTGEPPAQAGPVDDGPPDDRYGDDRADDGWTGGQAVGDPARRDRVGDRGYGDGAAVEDADVPEPRAGRSGGSRSGVERCGRSRSRHRAHGSAATPIVAAAAAAVRGRRRPAHGLPPRHA
ncbi:peptidoglycan/LPS O-acetylase OafA/YrhL [Pseudonocardia endophytica]|uniref:Peptidoglycan/LPS O-acetylase OafA/YrhL n=1 Tax=Pseudonocardia endophytica TaxID=401976 RepID=A0A4R1I264_PSEEN|nr:peptidoglycan/LPS O-acetylase OafA/YrhL [Pseudonocardia endophytica]